VGIKRRVETELASENLEDARLHFVRITHAEDELAYSNCLGCSATVEWVLPFRRADHKEAFAAAHAAGRGGGDTVELGKSL